MAIKYLLDTSTCFNITGSQSGKMLEYFKSLKVGEVAISAITYAELQIAAMNSREAENAQDNLQKLIEDIPVLSIDLETSMEYSNIYHDSKNQTIQPHNIWLAAQAKQLGLILVTEAVSDFAHISGLVTKNWVA